MSEEFALYWAMKRSVSCSVLVLGSVVALTSGGCDTLQLKPGATSIFEALQEPTVLEAAQMAIDKYDADKRYRGTLLLANRPFAGESLYMQLFTDNIKDEDPGVRAAAARAIGNHGKPSDAVLLIERLRDEDPTVRQEAARGLQRLHNEAAIESLLRAIDPDVEQEAPVRAEAAAALAQYQRPLVALKLITAMDDRELSVNQRAQQSLRTLTGQDFGLDRAAWSAWFNADPAPFAAGSVFVYPVFRRDTEWYEYIPFVPKPPNEVASTPAGMPLPGT